MSLASDPAERTARAIFGFAFHTILASAGSIVGGVLILHAINAAVPGLARNAELLPFILSSALLAAFATPRWLGSCAPWVGILGLLALYVGAHELIHGWSPTCSHQTRSDYVLSQLFCVKAGCSDSEGLYALFFGWPFLCLTTYALASIVALRLTRSKEIPDP